MQRANYFVDDGRLVLVLAYLTALPPYFFALRKPPEYRVHRIKDESKRPHPELNGCGQHRWSIPKRRGFWHPSSMIQGREDAMISFGVFLTRLSEVEAPRKTKDKLFRGALILLAAVATADRALPAEKLPLTEPELNALLANGLSVSSTDMLGGKYFTAHMTYATDGTLSGAVTFNNGRAPIDVKGTWKLDGPRLCRTILPFQPQEVCEIWLKSGSNEVTIRVGDTDLGVSRW